MAYEEQQIDHRYEALQKFEQKERDTKEQKRKDCAAKDHPIFKNRRHCRCGAMTRWQKEHPEHETIIHGG